MQLTRRNYAASNFHGLMHFILEWANCDDRKPVEDLIVNFQGDMFGDRGYISKDLFRKLYEKGVKSVTGLRKDMKIILMPLRDKILLKKRSVIETVFGFLKNTMMLEHSRHRSVKNFLTHIAGTIITYQLMPNKPAISPILAEIQSLNYLKSNP
jgi:hypothetical protein